MNITPLKKQARRGAIILWAAPAFFLGREKGRREATRGAENTEAKNSRASDLAALSSHQSRDPGECSVPWEQGEDCLEPLMHLLHLQEDMNVIGSHFSHYTLADDENYAIANAAFDLGDHRITKRVILSAHADVTSDLCKAAHALAMDLQRINNLAGLRVRGKTLRGAEEFRHSRELCHSYRICLEHKAEEMQELQSSLGQMLESGLNSAVENLTAHGASLGKSKS